ncbi:TPA: hypothetical protein ACFP4Y_001762 [Neisseria bacilliformis]
MSSRLMKEIQQVQLRQLAQSLRSIKEMLLLIEPLLIARSAVEQAELEKIKELLSPEEREEMERYYEDETYWNVIVSCEPVNEWIDNLIRKIDSVGNSPNPNDALKIDFDAIIRKYQRILDEVAKILKLLHAPLPTKESVKYTIERIKRRKEGKRLRV